MNKLLIAGIGLAGLIGGPALAADLRPPVAAPVEFFTWSGAYVGVNLGGGWRDTVNFASVLTNCTASGVCGDGGLVFGVPANLTLGSVLGTGPATRATGATAGFQVGYNYQFGWAVVGFEADWEYFKRNSSLVQAGVATTGDILSVSNEVSSTWLATVRGRLGFAWDRLLVYATGGVAFTDVSYTQTVATTLAGASGINVVTQTKSGGTVGGGAEYALWNSLTLRVEYLYAQFSGLSGTGTLVSSPPPPFASNQFTGTTNNLRDHIVRIGLNYKFGYGAVVASY